jgi:threonine aldolase
MLIDLRSDTVTRPTKGMLAAMASAEVGDDVFGDDPTVIRLQERVAEIVGKEAALYTPSGTMANQIALHVSTTPGDEVFCDEGCHILNYESGAAPLLSGIQLLPIAGKNGVFTAAQVEEKIRPRSYHFAPSRMIEIENTHNRAGGTIWPVEEVSSIRVLCDKHNLHLHLDGARIWNAAAERQCDVKEWTKYADTVSVCFSKGLGAPVGSAILGSKSTIESARRARKRFGGGMRQAGFLAAAALYAVNNHRERLVEDHAKAKKLAVELEDAGYEIDAKQVETNIVIFAVPEGKTGDQLVQFAAAEGVLLTSFGIRKLRAVTHLDVDRYGIELAINVFRKFLQ